MNIDIHRVISVTESSPKYYKDTSLEGYWVEIQIIDECGNQHGLQVHCLPEAKWDGLPIGDNTHA